MHKLHESLTTCDRGSTCDTCLVFNGIRVRQADEQVHFEHLLEASRRGKGMEDQKLQCRGREMGLQMVSR